MDDGRCSAVYRFGDWRVEPELNRLSRGGEELQLEPKTMDVLAYLIAHCDRVVAAEELLDQVWTDRVVEASIVHRRINQLRNALGDDSKGPRYIKTIVKRGYRAIAKVDLVEHTGSSPGASRSLSLKADKPAIAVLPFSNLGDTEPYFSEGVAEEILNRMIQVRDIRVISGNSSFAYGDSTIRELGNLLGADYVLQGSLRQSGSHIRVSVRLADTSEGVEVWGRSYDRELSDVLRLQDEIAQAVVGEVLPNVVLADSTRSEVDPVAYDLVLRARRALSAQDPMSAKPLVESAIQIDPKLADARVLLAGVLGHPRMVISEGGAPLQRAIREALRLDPEAPEVLRLEVDRQYHNDFDLQKAISAVEALIERFPNVVWVYQTYLRLLARALRFDEMLPVSEQIQLLDPQSTASALAEHMAQYVRGAFGAARRALDRVPMDFVGGDFGTGRRVFLFSIDIATGRLNEAGEHFAELKQRAVPPLTDTHIAILETWLAIERGDLEAARKVYASEPLLLHNNPWYWLPLDIVVSGSTSRTLEEIEDPNGLRALTWILRLQARDHWISAYGSPVFKDAFAKLRREPRYQKALRRYGIDEETLAKIKVRTSSLWK